MTNLPNPNFSTATTAALGSPANPYPPAARINVLAIVAIIAGFLAPLVGVICAHISLSQIKRTGESGYGLALTGLIAGYCLLAFSLLMFILVIVVRASIR